MISVSLALLALPGLASVGWAQCEEAKLTAMDATEGDEFGRAVAICGDTAVVGAHADDDVVLAAGSAYVFERTGTGWVETAKLTASDAGLGAQFGDSVSIDGDTALIGAFLDDGPPGGFGSGAPVPYLPAKPAPRD